MIAALFVQTGGCYFGLDGVDPWDEPRDARTYPGPYPVVAHPPCQRWGRYWSGGPSARVRRKLGDDGGCFASALASVRRFRGVLEHPANTHAWPAHGLNRPPWRGGWVSAGDGLGWVCCVSQGHYGHAARKATWLYYVGAPLDEEPPELVWGPSLRSDQAEVDALPPEERRRAIRTGRCQRLSSRQRAATPIPFRDMLLGLARGSRVGVVQ